MLPKTLLQESALYLIGNVVRRVVGFLMIPLYTRFLTPADYGVIELVELFISIAAITVGILAISDAMVRIYHEQPDNESRQKAVATAIGLVVVLSIVVACIAITLAEDLGRLIFGDTGHTWLVRVAFTAMVFSNLTEICLVYCRLMHRALFFAGFSIVQMLAGVGLNVYFIGYASWGANGFVLSKLIYSFCAALVLLFIVGKEVKLKVSPVLARKMVAFGSPLILTSASFFIIHFADRFFLRSSAGLADVGVYSLAYRFAFLVTILVGEPFGSSWGVSVYARARVSGWKVEFSRVARVLMLCLFTTGVALTLFIDEILMLVAEKSYWTAALVVPVLAFAYVCREIGDFFRSVLFINKRVVEFSGISVGCALLNLVLNAILIGRYHAQGAAWATLLTWSAYMTACWVIAQREHAIPMLARPFILLCGVSVAVWSAVQVRPAMPLLWSFTTDVALFVVAMTLVHLLGYFPRPEAALMRGYLSGRMNGVLNWVERLRWS
jgi:O-antigen/teichoic acid export membrane protein